MYTPTVKLKLKMIVGPGSSEHHIWKSLQQFRANPVEDWGPIPLDKDYLLRFLQTKLRSCWQNFNGERPWLDNWFGKREPPFFCGIMIAFDKINASMVQ